MPTIAGLASDRGQALLHLHERRPAGATVEVILTDRPDAPIVDAARDRGIDVAVIEPSEGDSDRGHDDCLLDGLADHEVDLVALDGYDRVLPDRFLEGVPVTLAVHPSLLPAFPEAPIEGAIDAGVTVSGATVYVATGGTADKGPDRSTAARSGPIVTQEPVPVASDDDPVSLEQRIREEGTFRAYPRAVEQVLHGDRRETGGETTESTGKSQFPDRRYRSDDRIRDLRYGENPHQAGAVYGDRTATAPNVIDAAQLNDGAKALSYNNYNDADAALGLVREFDRPAAAVIKHTNPAGCATADAIATAYDRALATDPKSAFGGIVALNRRCDRATAQSIVDSFKEAVVAPQYTEGALAVLEEKADLRVLAVGPLSEPVPELVEQPIVGGRLVQERDRSNLGPADLEVVTERSPTEEQVETLLFAWRTAKHVKSNAIVLADGTETVGIGMGQASRVDAVELATRKAERDAEGKGAVGSVMASDAFFPFPDGIEMAAEAGVEAVVQPGGSVNDDAVIEAANEHGLAMVFTGTRAFRHD
jgi:phosphoribosylaminoimidazolecarboxamide formyltransferase